MAGAIHVAVAVQDDFLPLLSLSNSDLYSIFEIVFFSLHFLSIKSNKFFVKILHRIIYKNHNKF